MCGLRCTVATAIVLCLLSVTAIAINFYYCQYPGNNYFPPNAASVFIMLVLMYSGFLLQFGRTSQLVAILKETIWFFIVMAVVALATNAAQYTPFSPIDQQIISFERLLHINVKTLIVWTHTKPLFKDILGFIYDTLPYQMAYLPLLLIIAKKWERVHEYYFLLLFSTLLGFTFYYFFPTTAPASNIHSPYFSEYQQATGLKFMQIHQHMQPSTIEGGLIAMPSFHVIWAWFCVYILQSWPIAFIIMLPINLLLIASCVLLGWHYPLDIVGGFLIILITHIFYLMCVKKIRVYNGMENKKRLNVDSRPSKDNRKQTEIIRFASRHNLDS